MFIQHTNRCSEIYYLYQSTTKAGNPKYFFSRKVKEGRLDRIPDGFEIYENPDAQVFLVRKVQPLITEIEKQAIVSALKKNKDVEYFIVDVKKNIITIYTANNEINNDFISPFTFKTINIQRFLNYMQVMRFILTDKNKRDFVVERFCYRGAIDDWINIGGPESLSLLARKYIEHIGKESIYNLPF